MNTRRVHIVGAGPAGLVAGINLARDGYEVILHEQKQEVGSRFHGEFQGLENWSTEEDVCDFLKTIGVFINFNCEPCHEAIFYGPKGKPVTISSRRPLFYLVERGSAEWTLDQGLKRQAVGEGVQIRWGSKLEIAPSGWVIVGTGPKAADAIARGIVFKTSHPDVSVGFLDNRIAPAAYAYLLVNCHRATFATCLFHDFQHEQLYFERALQKLRSVMDIDIQEPQDFGGFVNFFIKPSAVKNGHILYVGETAGFQDALWGFGLRYAMLSGYLAAVSIKTGIFYDDLCRKYLLPMQRTSLANRWLFAHLGNWGYRMLLHHMKNTDVIQKLREHYRPSRTKNLLYYLANRWYSTRLVDKQCMHQNCNCIWCRHCRTDSCETPKVPEKDMSRNDPAHIH